MSFLLFESAFCGCRAVSQAVTKHTEQWWKTVNGCAWSTRLIYGSKGMFRYFTEMFMYRPPLAENCHL
jgi:hypothetical protein